MLFLMFSLYFVQNGVVLSLNYVIFSLQTQKTFANHLTKDKKMTEQDPFDYKLGPIAAMAHAPDRPQFPRIKQFILSTDPDCALIDPSGKKRAWPIANDANHLTRTKK